jgi:o-succinylbenzoate synthase
MKASFQKYTLHFKRPAGTSRGVLQTKDTYLLTIEDQGKTGVGECALFRGLSADDLPDYEEKLLWLSQNINLPKQELFDKLKNYSSIIFGLEQAYWSLKVNNSFVLFDNKFTRGTDAIPINGLVWMGKKEFMLEQIKAKIAEGFSVIKLKIGAIDFDEELSLLSFIRNEFSAKDIEIRVDANGAFAVDNALEKLKRLSDFHIHSIEQPIKAGQFEAMAELCKISPIAIALDEELIGYHHQIDKIDFLARIKPQYIILKPALHGGFIGAQSWIDAANKLDIAWWITSALESNIGLNAIAQYTYQLAVNMPQGLGTGSLFSNNFDSPLFVADGALHFDSDY